MFGRKGRHPLRDSLRPGEEMHSIHRALDVGMLNAPCSVVFTTERIAWALDARSTMVLDAPYERFHGIGINWDTLDLAAEITNPPIVVQGVTAPPAAPTSYLALAFMEPIERESLDHALSYVGTRTSECREHGDVGFEKVMNHCRAMRM